MPDTTADGAPVQETPEEELARLRNQVYQGELELEAQRRASYIIAVWRVSVMTAEAGLVPLDTTYILGP
ncbi:hypothetical protein EXIGLDRAFT_761323 [Exidia glandulosa HHB12029]|uniref:Uncharacterized protein n=1 Tax=Exidia glandulosa HHB12029 TaxID=1314781 RepID=A0A165NHS7_EXIGL|nr:hypothetical protein EXIGLDRAFT_761323 [Exidia glandulosa HHB12029]